MVGANLANIAARDTQLLPDDSIGALLRSLLPARFAMKVGRDIPVFEDCDFSGLRGWFEPGIAQFHRCRFLDVNVRGQLMRAHFVGCQFSGTWEANFTTEAAREDPASRVVISGNDFRGLRGMDFFGVPEGANELDTAGDHLVLRKRHLIDPAVRDVLAGMESGWSHIDAWRRAGISGCSWRRKQPCPLQNGRR